MSSMGSQVPDSEVFQCPFLGTPFEHPKACCKVFAKASDARQHLNKYHQGRTVNVDFLVKTKTSQCQDCGKFFQSTKSGPRKHDCVPSTAYLPQSSDVVESVSAFEAEAVHSGPAPLEVQNEA